MDKQSIQIGGVHLSLDEVEETLSAIHAGKIDAVVVEGAAGNEVFTFRDPSHPFRLLIEAMNEGAVLTTLDGVLCYQNPCFSALVGVELAPSFEKRTLAELVVPQSRPALSQLLERARTGQVRGIVELIGPGDGPVPVQLSLSRARLVDVQVLCVVVTDLTEQRRQEQLYQAAREEIEARDRLVTVAAHELRNPLNVLELRAQLLAKLGEGAGADGTVPANQVAAFAEKVRAQTHRLGELLSTLLDLGKIGAGRLALSREEMDLADVVRGVIERAHDAIERSGSAISADLHPVHGRWDRVRLEQVIENLLSNAMKYGLGRPIRVYVESGDRMARIGIEDRGRGIPLEARDRIFRPYERVAEAAGIPGLGIGLYVTAEIVKAHGGVILVEGVPGGGSRFIVELPIERPTLH